MRWLMVAILVLLWAVGLFEGAGAYIHLILLIALLLSMIYIFAGRGGAA